MAMRQQINLYLPAQSDERKPRASRALGVVAAGVVVVLLMIWGFGSYQVSRLETAVVALRSRQTTQEQTMSAVSAMRPSNVGLPQLQAQVKRLTAEVTARQQALDLLHAGGAGQKGRFAARMTALARQHPDGLWIDSIVLSGTTGAMIVGGGTLNADLVPRYLRALADEAALNGTRFDRLAIERPRPKPEPGADEQSSPGAPRIAGKSIRFRAESNSLRAAAPEGSS